MFLSLIIAICSGGAVGLFFYILLSFVIYADISSSSEDGELSRHLPILLRLLYILVPLVRPFAKGEMTKSMRESSEAKLWMAGFGEVVPAYEFVGLRVICTIIALVIMILAALQGKVLYGLLGGVVIFIYPGVWLNKTIKSRHLSILKSLPNVLDLLTLSVEAGKDFLTSLKDILQRRKIDPLGEELLRTFQEIQLGRKRTEALKELTRRVRQADLTAVINAIIQAEELGVSIAQLLRIQGDLLRNKRFTMAEKLANEAPVKIIPAIVIFIMPAVFIILGVPIGMKLIDVL